MHKTFSNIDEIIKDFSNHIKEYDEPWEKYINAKCRNAWLLGNYNVLMINDKTYHPIWEDMGYGVFKLSFVNKNVLLDFVERLPFYKNLKQAYNNKLRTYHNWNHIEYILDTVVDKRIIMNDALLLAILFHDVVYTPGIINNNKTNIDKSISLLHEWASFYYEEDVINEAEHLITLTTDYSVKLEVTTECEKLMRDLDLAILSDRKKYLKYCTDIKEEVIQYTKYEVYREGRISWLKSMIEIGNFYHTSHFDYDDALFNLTTELNSLQR